MESVVIRTKFAGAEANLCRGYLYIGESEKKSPDKGKRVKMNQSGKVQ